MRQNYSNQILKNPAIIIFIRNPILGKVKTRIAATQGPEKALEIYRYLLELTRTSVQNTAYTKYLFYSDDILQDEWPEEFFLKRIQTGTDLGERMMNAFREVLSTHDGALIIGSDCASFDRKNLDHAIQELRHHDVVIGPAKDGGYYLLGMKRLIPDLFIHKSWSSDILLRQTLHDLKSSNLSFSLLQELNDIDEWEDWQEYISGQI